MLRFLIIRVSPISKISIRSSMRSKLVPSRDQVTSGGGAPVAEHCNCRDIPAEKLRSSSASMIVTVGNAEGEVECNQCHKYIITSSLIHYMIYLLQNSSGSRSSRFLPARLGGVSHAGPLRTLASRYMYSQTAPHPHSSGLPWSALERVCTQ